MLLEFKAKNYKTFQDELIFSLIPAPKQKGLDYSVLQEKIGKNNYKGLCSAVIYGPNASGKTNIIGAMDTFKTIVMCGNIRNGNNKSTHNVASNDLELIPNRDFSDVCPVAFTIKFIEENLLIEYSFEAFFGKFLETDAIRKIVSESLSVNQKMVFSRKGELTIGSLTSIKKFLINDFEKNKDGAVALAKSNLNDEELFLANGFKTMFSAKIVALINNWLYNKFIVIYRYDAMHTIPKLPNSSKEVIYIEGTFNEAVKCFGINSNPLCYTTKGDDTELKLYSLFKEKGAIIPAEIFESYGTIRFIDMFPLVVKALSNGGILVVDEFDASIHPMVLMSIINIFHNDDINKKNAQLVFNTHNPIFLNANLFRRDEIKFVERDDNTYCSVHYSLSDFGTIGKSGVRKNEDYMKNYFVNRYGAIKDIDFTPVFEDLLNN